jgi:molybdopterin adenylyltransferase
MSRHEHRRQAPAHIPAGVLTISDTRSPATDASGRCIRDLLVGAGHIVADYRIVPDDPPGIRKVIRQWSRNPGIHAMILTGGTGISRRDGTYEAIEKLLAKRLDGFGELFRALSFRQVGSAAYLSRAVAGICRGKPLFSIPGSEKAVALAMERLILPELGHLLQQLRK